MSTPPNTPPATPSLLDTVRALTAFEPPKGVNLRKAPWDEFVEWAIGQGIAPIAAYNLEYRMPGANAPDWVRDRLMSVYQGTSNDNVMKLVNFKRSIDELEGRRILAVGGVAFADALYPHVAFRPVPEIELWTAPADLDPLAGFLSHAEFRPELGHKSPAHTKLLSDGRTQVILRGSPLGEGRQSAVEGILARATPMRAFSPSLFRPSAEDALLIQCHALAASGFEVAMIELVDLRELLSAATHVMGPYSQPLDVDAIREQARVWKLDRAVWAALTICARLFPQTEPVVTRALPALRPATQRLLDRWVVEPAISLGKTRLTRGADRLKRLLAGAEPFRV